ncbi:alpha-glucuronidase family glycosyl hydrolase [Mangrovibacillus sp. Mu-81]|uniref:alpha-glucuronidase family glycosyl hydrolase n=1 Tax=Mangrovibacillus sp. Mu-81 TaxID=3121478 RepID=UPI002FE4CE5E
MKSIAYFNSHATTCFAVEELRRLFRQAGIELGMNRRGRHRDLQGSIFIMLEKEYHSSPLCKSPLTLSKDGFALIDEGDDVWIVGKEERSLLYGVYSFCEKKLGYSWVHLNEGRCGTYTENATSVQTPLFSRRGNIIETIDDPLYINRLIDWGVKNGLNEFFFTFFLWDKVKSYVEPELVKRNMKVTLGGHSLAFLTKEMGMQPNHLLRDSGMQDHVISRIHEICIGSPVVNRVSLWPEDIGIDQDEYDDFMPAYITFSEKLRASLKELNVEVEHIVYNAGLEWKMLERAAGTNVSQEADVLYAYWGRDYSASIHEASEEQKRAAASLMDWRTETKIKNRSFTVLEYYSDHFMLSELFPPLLNRMKQDMADYKKLQADGVLNLIVPCHIKPLSQGINADYPWKWIHGLNNFLYAGLCWGKDFDSLVDAYFSPLGEKKETYLSIILELENILAKHTAWNVPLFPARLVDTEKVKARSSQEIVTCLDELIDFLNEHTPAVSEELLDIQNKDNFDSFTMEEMLQIYFYYVKKTAVRCKREWQGGNVDGLQSASVL